MTNPFNTLGKTTFAAYYFLIALLPGVVLGTYYAGLTRKGISIHYTDYSVVIKVGTAIASALLVELIMLIMRRASFQDALKNPQSLLIGILVALCLPNNSTWWMVLSSVAFAIIVGHYVLSNRLHAVLIGYIFSLATFPASHGLSTLIRSEVYYTHLLDINIAFLCGGLFLAGLRLINWRLPITLLVIYSVLAITFKVTTTNMVFSVALIKTILTPTTCLGIFFIAPFVVRHDANSRTCFLNGMVIAVVLFLLSQYARYPNALLPTLLVMNILNWAWNSKNVPLDKTHVTDISSHVLLTPILAASVVMVIASSTKYAAMIGAVVVLMYLSAQSISDVIKRFAPQANSLSLTIVLIAFFSSYIGLSIKVYLPTVSPLFDGFIPILALSSLLLSCSGIFAGEQPSFNMNGALKTSALFFILVLLMGAISQFTDANRLFSAGLFLLFASIALFNNSMFSIIQKPPNKPNRRVRTTGTIK